MFRASTRSFTSLKNRESALAVRAYDFSTGFTLIELLVVIAIIGLLSSVVLASLNVARKKGQDAAIQADMHAIQIEAQIYYDNNGSYGPNVFSSACTGSYLFSDPNINKACQQISSYAWLYHSTDSAGSRYVILTRLTASGSYWCIDSTGTSKEESSSAPIFTMIFVTHACS
ncbi:MAG: hypothetical protein B7X04_03445 [Parcubacteria group bacterium 21-54-25]|nr:MAG: hypothetical protein B7X04_03445 [Parcubacteria group bacterium 21-54-25]HQU08018.1 type II secretion system protein [Candidatus Paceibacterota bacterium]